MDEFNKRQVAIESTDDYADPSFHRELIDVDILNKDGSYGKIKDFYRIVTLNDEGKIAPYDTRVFDNEVEAKTAVRRDSSLKLIGYDDIVHEAERIHFSRIQSRTEEPKPWKPEILSNLKKPQKNYSMDR